MMSHRATLVFVPGAWHNSSIWNKITSLMKTKQYNCISVNLPSASSNPSAAFLDDVNAVRDSILAETIKGRDVVLVTHSYGGQVGSSAIKGLGSPRNSTSPAEGKYGHVVGLVMLASGGTETGVGFLEAYGGKPPPSWRIDLESGFAIIVANPRELFYHDLPVEEGNYWVSKLEKQSGKALAEGGEHAYSGWRDSPLWYLATTEDKAFPVEVQRFFVQVAKDAGVDVTLKEIDSSHSPMLSKPNETTDFILEAVAYFAGEK